MMPTPPESPTPESPTPESPTPFPALIDRVVVLTGPTASGKSEVAVELAEHIGGEIVSLDSIAVYRDMNIGTAKPSPDQCRRVPHHMIDVVSPAEDYSVVRYLDAVHPLVDEIESRGRKAVFVGGSPLFLKAILRGFDPGPPADWEFRDAVEKDVARYGKQALHRRLARVDPLSAHRIDPTDTRRMIRALEVARFFGHPLSHRQVQFDQTKQPESCEVFALQWPRDELNRRIERRVEMMFERGLVAENRRLIAKYTSLSRTASQAVGYRELLATLAGTDPTQAVCEQSLSDAKTAIATHTRQLAKRQRTWIRSFQEITPIEMTATRSTDSVVREIRVRELPGNR